MSNKDEELKYNCTFNLVKPSTAPIKIWRTCSKEIIPPKMQGNDTSIQWNPGYNLNQLVVDKYSKLDGDYFQYEAHNHDGKYEDGRIAQIMFEVDLTEYCKNRFNGDNNLLRKNFKSADVVVYCKGSGVVDNVVKYGCELYVYGWDKWNGDNKNHTNEIKEISFKAEKYQYISSDNKIYILVKSLYPTGGEIDSSIAIDYFEIKPSFKSESDIIENIQLSLGDKWNIQGELFPNFNSIQDDVTRGILNFQNGNDRLYLEINKSFIRSAGVVNGVISGYGQLNLNIEKWKSIKYFMQKNDSEIQVKILYNGKFKDFKFTLKNDIDLSNCELTIGAIRPSSLTVDSFINVPDLELNKIKTNDEIESQMKLSKNFIPNFNSQLWQLDVDSRVENDGKKLILNAKKSYVNNFIEILLFPNNKYEFKMITDDNLSGSGIRGVISQLQNKLTSQITSIYKIDSKSIIFELKLEDGVNAIRLNCTNDNGGVGVFTFENLSLKIVR